VYTGTYTIWVGISSRLGNTPCFNQHSLQTNTNHNSGILLIVPVPGNTKGTQIHVHTIKSTRRLKPIPKQYQAKTISNGRRHCQLPPPPINIPPRDTHEPRDIHEPRERTDNEISATMDHHRRSNQIKSNHHHGKTHDQRQYVHHCTTLHARRHRRPHDTW